jgi:penicillin-binding protein 1A
VKGFTQLNAPTPGQSGCPGPVGIRFVAQGTKKNTTSPSDWHNTAKTQPVSLTYSEDKEEIEMLHEPLTSIGTAADAFIPGVNAWGKTGTTSNYGDAWFVGSTAALNTPYGTIPSMTVAVWVGYPSSDKSMSKDYGGKPVYGGTYPALIWRDYVVHAIQTIEQEDQYATLTAAQARSHHAAKTPSSATGSNSVPVGASAASGATGTGAGTGAVVAPSTGATPSAPSTPTTPATSQTGGAPAAGTPPTGTTAPSSSNGTATGGGTTTPTTPPPSTGQGGGVTAPGGGTVAP